MLLSELSKLVKEQEELANKLKVDPEVRIAAQPKWPIESSVEPSLVSTLNDEEPPDGHLVYILEQKEIGWLNQGIVEAAGWNKPAPKRRTK